MLSYHYIYIRQYLYHIIAMHYSTISVRFTCTYITYMYVCQHCLPSVCYIKVDHSGCEASQFMSLLAVLFLLYNFFHHTHASVIALQFAQGYWCVPDKTNNILGALVLLQINWTSCTFFRWLKITHLAHCHSGKLK